MSHTTTINQAIQVLADVDNTLVSNSWLQGGFESENGHRYKYLENHTIYPGALTLMHEISRSSTKTPPPGIALLSARCTSYHIHQASKGEIADKIRSIGWHLEGILYGTMYDQILGAFEDFLDYLGMTSWVNLNRKMRMGLRKFINLKNLILANGESLVQGDIQAHNKTFVFFGDNGEGDVYAADCMLSDTITKKRMRACFIHHAWRNEYEKKPRDSIKIFYFNNYAEAAKKAFLQELITIDSLAKVILSIKTDLSYQKAIHQNNNSPSFRRLVKDTLELEEIYLSYKRE